MKTRVLLALLGLLVPFAACGKVGGGGGGGDSETHWVKQCQTERDCAAGTTCSCGMCSKVCDASSDCSGLGAQTNCVDPSEIPGCSPKQQVSVCVAACSSEHDCPTGFECSSSGCTPRAASASGTGGTPGAGGGTPTPVEGGGAGEEAATTGGMPSEAGRGGAPSSNGGAACVEVPWSYGGAFGAPPFPPPVGTPCPASEGLEVCSSPDGFSSSPHVLSLCSSGVWSTIENPSECLLPDSFVDQPRYDQYTCNNPAARDGSCCSLTRYCDRLNGYCDGERWWIGELPTSGSCGDGIRQQREECDDGNSSARDDCLPSCVEPQCGDGFVHDQGTGSEACDEGANNGPFPAACSTTCQPALCGNGELDGGEECDHGLAEFGAEGEYLRGNHENAACTPTCVFNHCGDAGAYVYEVAGQDSPNELEECDDVFDDSDPCTTECRWNRCGDGRHYKVQYQVGTRGDGNPLADNPFALEACDDGNLSPGDGCDTECLIER